MLYGKNYNYVTDKPMQFSALRKQEESAFIVIVLAFIPRPLSQHIHSRARETRLLSEFTSLAVIPDMPTF